MPGMGALGTPNAGEFYLYLVLELLIVACLVWLGISRRVGRPPASATGRLQPAGRTQGRLILRRGLGALWIIDGLLQAQPAMPTRFATSVLGPAALGQPGWIAHLIRLEVLVWQAHPLDLAAAAVLVQVGMGVAILAGGDSQLGRLALWTSIAWSLLIWVGAEGLGGILAPHASEITGAPGAVLLYGAGAALLLAPVRLWSSDLLPRLTRRGVGVLLLLGALLQALPGEGFWSGSVLAGSFSAMAQMAGPGWLAGPIAAVARIGTGQALLMNATLVGVMAVLGAGLLSGRGWRIWSGAALVWLAATWWLGQDLGGLGTGTATDPNLSPLVGLVLVSAWVASSARWAELGQPTRQRLSAAVRQRLALGGVAALLVGSVPAALGLPIALLEAPNASAATTAAVQAGVSELPPALPAPASSAAGRGA
ncbi:MAG TPA: hypothetical protein VI138_00875 [Candidatus Dormibacteraeota bacterium]